MAVARALEDAILVAVTVLLAKKPTGMGRSGPPTPTEELKALARVAVRTEAASGQTRACSGTWKKLDPQLPNQPACQIRPGGKPCSRRGSCAWPGRTACSC